MDDEQVDELVHKRWGEIGFENLFPEERDYIWLWCLRVEVENGSFDQYFFNSAGDDALEALAALARVGAMQTHSILSRALAVLDSVGGFSKERFTRQDRMEPLAEDAFDKPTQAFYDGDEAFMSMAIVRVVQSLKAHGIIDR